MYCVKCGRDTVANKIFCEECLRDMDRYPVKPGTAIQLPQRTPKSAPKKPAKRTSTPEEQIHGLKRARFWLMILVVLLSAALCLSLLYPRTVKTAPAVTTTETTTESTTAATTEVPPQTTAKEADA